MIQITRKEQQVLKKLKAVMTAEQVQTLTEENLQNVDPSQNAIDSLVDKGIIIFDEEQNCYTLTKEQLQVLDDDPEVEQAWEDFRAVQGAGHMSKIYERNRAAEKASKHLEEVLFRKGRLVHMVNDDDTHIWVTDNKVQFWQNRGYREASPKAVPTGLDD